MNPGTLANIEKGIHLLWPNEWLRDTKHDLGKALRNAEGVYGERIAKAYTAVVAEIERRKAA